MVGGPYGSGLRQRSCNARRRFVSSASLRIEPFVVGGDEHREVLGHLAAFHGRDDGLLKGFGEVGHRWGAVELRAVLEAAGPRVD